MKQISNIFILLSLVYFYDKCYYVNCLSKYNYLCNIINGAFNRTNQHQIVLLIPKACNESTFIKQALLLNNKNHYSIIKCISTTKCSLIIEISKLEIYRNNFHLYSNLMGSTRKTTVFVSIFSIDSDNTKSIELLTTEFKQTVEIIIHFSPSSTRPRYLLILDNNGKVMIDTIRNLLNYAWTYKFLDLTVIQILPDYDTLCSNHVMIHSYNPFTNIHSINCYHNQSTIFYNKLRNMNKYPLSIALVPRKPDVVFDRNASGYPINLKGSDFGRCILLSEAMNFSMQLIAPSDTYSYLEPMAENDSTSNLTNLLDLIIQGNIDFSGNQIYLHLALSPYLGMFGEMCSSGWLDDFIILVPIYPSAKLQIAFNTFITIINILCHVSLMYIIAKICKFKIKYWLPYNIFQVFLGNPAPVLPPKTIERLFYIILFALSRHYCTKLYADFAGANINQLDQGPYNTFEELINSDIIIETFSIHKNMTFYDGDYILQKLEKKVRVVNDILKCTIKAYDDNLACLIDRTIAYGFIQTYKNQEQPKIKIFDHVFWSAAKGIIFSSASPYTPQVKKVIRSITEYGLWLRWTTYSASNKMKEPMFYTHDKFLRGKLIEIWLLGCFISCIAFITELLMKYVIKK